MLKLKKTAFRKGRLKIFLKELTSIAVLDNLIEFIDICGGRCLGNRLDTVAPSLPVRNEGMYSSVTNIFEQYYLNRKDQKTGQQVYDE